MKSNKGITLVALIITVVIMLILAGVAIGSVTGDGLFSKTRDAVGAYENATRTEAEQIQTLMNEINNYLTGGNGGEGTDTTAPTTATIESSNVEETTFTLTATGADGESGIAKYEFYINNTLENTVTTTEETATYDVSGKTAGTSYTCKVIVYDNAGNSKESSEITVTTKTAGVDPETVAKIGDFVNYSVEVDSNGNGTIEEGETYDKWRILDFDNNGHMEIVCYNGPIKKFSGKSDYCNAIRILNDASAPYKNGTYGYSARHLGSNPSSPSSYATISTSYVKFYKVYYSSTSKPTTNLAYLEQTHHETDKNALATFSGTNKLSGSYSWLASRLVYVDSRASGFCVRHVNSDGIENHNYLYYAFSDGTEQASSHSNVALAPVVSLQSGIKAIPGSGNGSEGNPWRLTL